jgi:CRP/FNR family transcriptional regulator, cyclic AMP receptor protein
MTSSYHALLPADFASYRAVSRGRSARSCCVIVRSVSTASELIRTIDFFQSLDDRLIDRIARLCIIREYSPGDYIVRQGDPGLGLYFITSGSAKVEIVRDGAILPIAELRAGDFVGELSIIDNKPRSANVVCSTDASCLLLTRDSFIKLINKYPDISLQVAKALAARLRSTDERMWRGAQAMLESAPAKISDRVPELRPHADAKPRTDEQKIKDMLTDAVSWIYLLKSVTQVSLALVGCPVIVNLETRTSLSLIRSVGPLKLLLVPSCETHLLGVHAFGDGAFKATILQPVTVNGFTGVSVSRFTAPVRRNESTWLRLPAFEAARIVSGAPGATRSRSAHVASRISAQGEMRELEAALDL